MKKIFTTVLCFVLLLFLAGCSQNSSITSSGKDVNLQEPITTSSEYNDVEYSYIYRTFEQAFGDATDVVVATFVGARPYSASYMELEFEVKDRILGSAGENIRVYAQDINIKMSSDISYSAQDLYLEKGKEYMFPLYHRVSVYNSVDFYEIIANTVVDMSELINSKMYNQPLSAHIKGFDLAANDSKALIEYVKELVKNNEPSSQIPEMTELKDVVALSTDVLHVTVQSLNRVVTSDFRDTAFYICKVEEALKGDLKEGETVEIIFFNGTVKEGDEIIVALDNKNESTIYSLTSKESVFDLQEKDNISALISQ